MKITKENVYIDLRGKSKEELMELYDFLISVGEKPFRDKEWFLNYSNDDEKLGFSGVHFCGLGDLYKDKTEVTIEELKEILKPIKTKEEQLIKEAKERGFLTEGNEFYSCFSDKNKLRIIEPYNSKLEINLYLDKGGCLRYYDGLNNKYDESLCSNPAIYKDGVWAEIKNNNLTLTEQLQKAEAEVQRLKEVIEEENKIKVGDWAYIDSTKCFFKVRDNDFNFLDSRHRRITNQELIKLLEQEIK